MDTAFDLKSTRLDAFCVRLHSLDLTEISSYLDEKLDKFKMFAAKPFVLDVSVAKHFDDVKIDEMLPEFAQRGFRIIGVRHQERDWADWATTHDLLWLPEHKSNNKNDNDAENDAAEVSGNLEDENITLPQSPEPETISETENNTSDLISPETQTEEATATAPEILPLARPTLVVNSPVRTGQQVYAENADLIVLGMVSEGAEVIADGNIHIYAPMRGRALAGESGDKTARIFVQSMQAELVSIAGIYRVFEQNLPPHLHKKAVQIELQDDDRLAISAINAE